ncbi:recombinase family protein [Lactiplantibacillus herbarum]|uniref:recombinase family protein n=1 Tax=Lactiplantibacillus herbarum TaxID=1670446 RepID=UPI00064F6DE0|nr:recombinase family protein [Lactiplantibacillus herbarum]
MRTIKIGYARVSTGEDKQAIGLEVQVRALKRERCSEIITEKESGTNDDRPLFAKALTLAETKADEGYRVLFVVYKLDRLARHLAKSILVIDNLKVKGIHVISLHEGIDTSTPVGLLQSQMLSVFSEYEVNQIRQRTKAALALKKAKGEPIGRKRIEPKVERKICRLFNIKEYPVEKIVKEMGVSRATVYNIAKRNNLRRRPKSRTLDA